MLTKLELAVLKAIDASEYGDDIRDAIWTWSVWDNIDKSAVKTRRSLSGAISSLTKKGLVSVSDSGTNDAAIRITEAGLVAYREKVPAYAGGKLTTEEFREKKESESVDRAEAYYAANYDGANPV